MSKDRRGAKSTLGDSSSAFIAQWRAARVEEAPAIKPELCVSGLHGKDDEQMLRSWKRGGGEVKVVKGNSIGAEKRRSDAVASASARRPKEGSVAEKVAQKSSSTWRERPNLPPPRSQPALQPTPPAPPHKSARLRLSEVSADLRQLKIAAAMSRPHAYVDHDRVLEDKAGKLAILGLDFGTAFTKAVVRWTGRYYAVDWSGAVEGEDHHLLASVFSEAPDGRCMLGAKAGRGWSVREGIKLQLLTSETITTGETLADAVIFIALAFRYVDRWLRRRDPAAAAGIRWRLHLGLPTKAWDNDATTDTFKTLAQAARVLACMPGSVTRAAALEALTHTDQVDRPAVDVFPEFACQLYSYLQSPERMGDLHALVDIGAGTIDVAYFNVFMKDGEPVLPIFASEVEKLGAHYLIAALAGEVNDYSWTDEESSLSDEEVGRKLSCPPIGVCKRRSLYLSSVADVFNTATSKARKAYPTSPAFKSYSVVRLFLCGGGSRIPSLRERFERIAREAVNVMGITLSVSELVKPLNVVVKVDSGFDRLSVAYGLSQISADIGRVMRTKKLERILPKARTYDIKDRDDDR